MSQMNLFDQAKKKDLFADVRPHIVKKFWEYHDSNPHVFPLFEKFAKDVKSSGHKAYGAQAIFERIRWHINIETRGDNFKLNNNYRSCYARLLIMVSPEFEDFFRRRSRV